MSPFQEGQYCAKNYSTASLVVLSCSGSTKVGSTRAVGAPRHLEHTRVPQEVPVPPRMGPGHAEMSRMDPWMAIVPVSPGWAHTETHRGRPGLPNHLPPAMEMQNICALLGLVSQHRNLFIVSQVQQTGS